MTGVAAQIYEEMLEDMISNGWLEQAVQSNNDDIATLNHRVREVLCELLSSAKVEIGETSQEKPGYVSLIAWRGSIESRIDRAFVTVQKVSELNKAYAYWLVLRENVDRFEDEIQK